MTFACLGAVLTVGVPGARPLLWFFLIYGGVCLGAYLVPSELGANVIRVRFAAFPFALLVLALRRWRPLPFAVAAAALAFAWNTEPLLRNVLTSGNDPEASAAYWQPAVTFLRAHRDRSFRVEAVDTTMHSAAFYLASAGIPLARGWFRQDDFPVNALLYRTGLTRARYLHWLRELGVSYVVLSTAPADYSARAESALLRSARSGLTIVFHDRHLTIYRVPHPQAIVVGSSPARVLAFTAERVEISLKRAGWYLLAVRYSPYWHASRGCLEEGRGGMLRLQSPSAGRVSIAFDLSGGNLIDALFQATGNCAANPELPSNRKWLLSRETRADQ